MNRQHFSRLSVLLGGIVAAAPILAVAGPEDSATGSALRPNEVDTLVKLVRGYEAARNYDPAGDSNPRDPEEVLDKALQAVEEAAKGIAEAHEIPSLVSNPDLLAPVFRSLSERKKDYKKGRVSQASVTIQLERVEYEREYQIQVPRRYNLDSSWPAVLALPPRGTKASNYLKDAWFQGKARESILAVAIDRKKGALDFGRMEDQISFFAPFRDLRESYAVDYDRIVLDAAGDAAADALEAALRYPGVFSGVVLRSPRGDLPSIEGLGSVPLLVVETRGRRENDPTQAAAEALVNASPASGSQLLLAKGNPARYDKETLEAIATWVEGAVRTVTYAEQIRFEIHQWGRLGWLEVLDMETSPYVLKEGHPLLDAKLDREANAIEVSTKFVHRYRVYLSPKLLDLGREITIRTNGQVSFVGTVKPSLERLLQFQFTDGDPSALYLTWQDIDVAADEKKAESARAEKAAGAAGVRGA